MALTARERQLKSMLDELGLKIESTRPSGGRYAITVRAKNGAQREFRFAQHMDGGGARGFQNEKAMVRRWLTSVTLQSETAVAAALRHAGVVKSGEGDLIGFELEKAPQTLTTAEPVAAVPAEPVPAPPVQFKEEPMAPQTQLKAVTAKRSQANKLTQTEFYRLCEWLKAKNLQDADTTQVTLAMEATKALNMVVVDSTVGTALKAIGVQLKAARSLPAEVKRDRTRIVARELVNLLHELGKEPSAELLACAS